MKARGVTWVVAMYVLFVMANGSCSVFPLYGKPDAGYYVQVEIGSPPEQFHLLMDTGSSNLAVAAYPNVNVSRYFNASTSQTYHSLDKTIEVSYTQGHWSGVLGKDLVKLHPSTIAAVVAEIALIEDSSEFFENGSGWHGILGLGFAEISIETLDGYKPAPYFDIFVQTAHIPNSFSLQLCGAENGPFSDNIAMGGNFSIGHINEDQYVGDLFTASVVHRGYYQVIVTDIEVDSESLEMDCVSYNKPKAIVDSGTTNLRLPNDVFNRFVQQLRKNSTVSYHVILDEQFWRGESSLCVPHGEDTAPLYNMFPPVTLYLLHVNSLSLALTVAPQQYLRPVQPPDSDTDCYKLAVTPSAAGTVIGAVVMEGYYVYFDRENSTVAFGETTCPTRVSNAAISRVSGYSPSSTLTSCYYNPASDTHLPTYAIVLFVIGSVLVATLLIFVILKLSKQLRKRRSRNDSDFDTTLMDGIFDTEY